jgi:hypothetical protein
VVVALLRGAYQEILVKDARCYRYGRQGIQGDTFSWQHEMPRTRVVMVPSHGTKARIEQVVGGFHEGGKMWTSITMM